MRHILKRMGPLAAATGAQFFTNTNKPTSRPSRPGPTNTPQLPRIQKYSKSPRSVQPVQATLTANIWPFSGSSVVFCEADIHAQQRVDPWMIYHDPKCFLAALKANPNGKSIIEQFNYDPESELGQNHVLGHTDIRHAVYAPIREAHQIPAEYPIKIDDINLKIYLGFPTANYFDGAIHYSYKPYPKKDETSPIKNCGKHFPAYEAYRKNFNDSLFSPEGVADEATAEHTDRRIASACLFPLQDDQFKVFHFLINNRLEKNPRSGKFTHAELQYIMKMIAENPELLGTRFKFYRQAGNQWCEVKYPIPVSEALQRPGTFQEPDPFADLKHRWRKGR